MQARSSRRARLSNIRDALGMLAVLLGSLPAQGNSHSADTASQALASNLVARADFIAHIFDQLVTQNSPPSVREISSAFSVDLAPYEKIDSMFWARTQYGGLLVNFNYIASSHWILSVGWPAEGREAELVSPIGRAPSGNCLDPGKLQEALQSTGWVDETPYWPQVLSNFQQPDPLQIRYRKDGVALYVYVVHSGCISKVGMQR
jgi:hypothetical protein